MFVFKVYFSYTCVEHDLYFWKSADKSLARPGRKQATATEDFDFLVSYL